MRFTTSTNILAAAAVARVASAQDAPATGELGDALAVENNPVGAVYRATFGENPFFTPDTPAGGPVIGEVVAATPPDGVGVMFKVNFQNLPKEGGPFGYHLHVDPVPADGNCTLTLAHLDPFVRGESPACDPATPQACQVGDLSGKHGKVEVAEGVASYQNSFWDDYLALYEGPGAFFGNRSIVLHFANKTRIGCANFELMSPGVVTEEGGHDEGDDEEDCTTTTAEEGAEATETATAGGSGVANGTTTADTTATAPTSETTTESGDDAQATGEGDFVGVNGAAGKSGLMVGTWLAGAAGLFFML